MTRPGLVGRRPVIAGGVALATTGALSACGSDDAEQPDSAKKAQEPAGSDDKGSKSLVATADVPVGGAVGVKDAAGQPVIVAQPSEGEIVAFTAVCTHKGCTVVADGEQLKCPCHQSVFEAFTGKNVSGPAASPLAAVPVKIVGDQVMEG